MEWIEHSGSGSQYDWNPTGGQVTALNVEGKGIYAAIIIEKYPGQFYLWDFAQHDSVLMEGVSTMEEAQAVATALYKMGE